MGWFGRNRIELRANQGEVQVDDALLKALLGGGAVTKEMALQVPTVSGGIDLIANIIASTPIKLYKEHDGKTQEIKNDPRIALLNDETGDMLNANEFWRAVVRDYFTGKGGYAYIHKEKGQFKSLHYVDEAQISIARYTNPIFKDFEIYVQGKAYQPFDFLKILRNTRDGAEGIPITKESGKLIEVAYASLVFEKNMVRRGGNKKGFLKAEKKLDRDGLDSLKDAFSRLYSSESEGSENFVLLNNGIDFKESSNTSVEMQLNENKLTNAGELAKIFHVSTDVMSGKATEADTASLAKLAAIPLMTTIQCALNKDFLLEKEKGIFYWAFDTKELLKGDIQGRFNAYKTALDANFMQIDEVRFAEDLEPLGLSWVKLGLNDVLYDPKTKTVYTPNTNQTSVMGEEALQSGGRDGTLETEQEIKPSNAVAASDVKAAAQEVAGKTLNGAQTQSLITVVQQFQNGTLTLQQAVNIIAVSIGVSRDEANELIGASIEQRAGNWTKGKDGKFTGSTSSGESRKTKYAPSQRRNSGGITVGVKKYAKLCGTLGTQYPDLKNGEKRTIRDAKYKYSVTADGYGGMTINGRKKI